MLALGLHPGQHWQAEQVRPGDRSPAGCHCPFAAAKGCELIGEFVEVETGKVSRRAGPQAEARRGGCAQPRKARASVVVRRLRRLWLIRFASGASYVSATAEAAPCAPPSRPFRLRCFVTRCGYTGISAAYRKSPSGSCRRQRPHVREPQRLDGLAGRDLELVEPRVLRRLSADGFRGEYTRVEDRGQRGHALDEQTALRLALMFRALAPTRQRDRMRAVAEGVEAMGRKEAAYWLRMTLHRRNPRRALTALRYLLTDPSG
jgi:hypothetical protein